MQKAYRRWLQILKTNMCARKCVCAMRVSLRDHLWLSFTVNVVRWMWIALELYPLTFHAWLLFHHKNAVCQTIIQKWPLECSALFHQNVHEYWAFENMSLRSVACGESRECCLCLSMGWRRKRPNVKLTVKIMCSFQNMPRSKTNCFSRNTSKHYASKLKWMKGNATKSCMYVREKYYFWS